MVMALSAGISGQWPGAHGVVCRFSCYDRRGGVSSGVWNSLNVGRRLGDSDEAVDENRRRIRQNLGLGTLVSAHQVHGTAVACWEGKRRTDVEIADSDALMTDRPGAGLLIQQADCQAVLLFDPVQNAVAAVHCGWRGSVQGILSQVVAAMGSRYGSAPADLLAMISPSLGPCCAEFVNHRDELPEEFRPFQVADNHFDFWRISRSQLIAAGMDARRVTVSGICTACSEEYFSYRRACRQGNGRTGRNCSVIALCREAGGSPQAE
jgi:polyphenol oxidase